MPEDVKAVAVPALAHRITLRPELWVRRISADDIVAGLVQSVPTPRTTPAQPRRAGRGRAGQGPGARRPSAPARGRVSTPPVVASSATLRRALGRVEDPRSPLEPPHPRAVGWRLSERGHRLAVVAGCALVPALVTGHAWAFALAAGPVVWLLLAAAAARPDPVTAQVRVPVRRCFEGEALTARIELSYAGSAGRLDPAVYPGPRRASWSGWRAAGRYWSSRSPRAAGDAGAWAPWTWTSTTAAGCPGRRCGWSSTSARSSRCRPTVT